MAFLYLRDPLFLACVAMYFVNRLVFKTIWTTGFAHEHFNDVVCIPFWVPIMLSIQRMCRLRKTDEPPTTTEIVIPLVVWSWLFEVYFPAMEWFGDRCVADYLDVAAYAVGALAAAIFWRWWYRKRQQVHVSCSHVVIRNIVPVPTRKRET